MRAWSRWLLTIATIALLFACGAPSGGGPNPQEPDPIQNPSPTDPAPIPNPNPDPEPDPDTDPDPAPDPDTDPDPIEDPAPIPIPVPAPPDQALPTPSPSDLNFGEVPLQTSRELTLQVTNLGGTSLDSEVRIDPISAPFHVSPSELQLEAQASAELVVRFAPLQLGAFSARLIITGENPAEVQLSGDGVTPEATLAPTTTTCSAATAVGEACQVTLTLSANSLELVGFSFAWQARRYRLTSVEAAALISAKNCSVLGGPAIIAGVCSDSVTGSGTLVRLNLERLEAGPNRLLISNVELFTAANAVHPIAGGSLDLP